MMTRLVRDYGYSIADRTIGRLIADGAARNGDKTFLTYLPDGRTYSYKDVHLLSNRMANALKARGIAKGDHVAVMMDNCPEQFLTYLALNKLGAVAVPLNTAARGMLLSYAIGHSDAVALIAEQSFLERFNEVKDDVAALRLIVLLDDGAEPVDRLDWTVEDFPALLEGSPEDLDEGVTCGDLAMLAYTSGTTGPSKGNMLAQATAVYYGLTTAESHGYRDDDVIYVCLPINHANALLCGMYGAWVADASVAMARRFSASGYWRDIRASGATLTNLLGSMMNIMWAQPESDADRDNSLRMANVVPTPPFGRAFEKRFGLRLTSGFGLTDYCLGSIYTILDPASKYGSAGLPRSGVTIRVVDDFDVSLPAGEVGEIVLRTDNLWGASQGYYKNAEATMASFRNGWWHTGDRGYLDADGYLYFADRKKDAIRRRGENISSFEVETILLQHPAIADVAVYAVKSEMSEDEVAASIMLAEGQQLSAPELIEYAARNMAYYMVPRFIQFVADFPRTQSQKVEKYKVKQAVEADRSLLWDREAAGIIVKR